MSSGEEQREHAKAEPDEALGAELARWVRPDALSSPDLNDLRLSLDAELTKERGPSAFLRSRSTPMRVLGLCLALLVLALLTVLTRARADWDVYPLPRMLMLVALMAGWFVGSTWLALWPLSRPALPTAVRRGFIAFGPALLLVLYSLPVAHTDHAASLQAPGTSALLLRAVPCLMFGAVIAAGTYSLLRAFDRGGRRANLLMASAGGLSANLLLQLHCPVTAPEHMLVAHLGAALAILGAVWLMERAASRG
jgi:hypothetical protein